VGERADLQRRARAAGLTQETIGTLLGYTEVGVSKGIRRDPPSQPVVAAVTAWELMDEAQRRAWLEAVAAAAGPAAG
jgi:ParB-like chromosome segregation protein Spo0J